jgi:hypothetical protein
MSEVQHVFKAITAITAVMSKEGISKSRSNQQQGYRFRGIDDVYGALSTHLAAVGLCILPRVVDRTVTERATKSGGVSTYVVVTVEFDLVSSVDGSRHMIRTMGEAMDSADKATNKAMSAAMKYACLMAFQIPTEGDNDADAHTHDLAPALSRSVEENWPKWRERLAIKLKAARSMGEMREEWSSVLAEADKLKAPKEHVEWLALVKDRAKLELKEPTSNGAQPT